MKVNKMIGVKMTDDIDNVGVSNHIDKQILIQTVRQLADTITNFTSIKAVREKENELLDMIDNLPIVRNNT